MPASSPTAPVPSASASPSTAPIDARLKAARERFVALWGQMASNWGIPRSMAEVHALLLVAGSPMNTDDLMETLRISRGSASMTLKALQEWGVVSRVHIRGDRKEYFQAEQDIWKLFRTILRERKKREIDPLLDALRECRELTSKPPAGASRKIGTVRAIDEHNKRLDSMLEFITMIDALSERLIASGKGLQLAAKILAKAS
jgi:DNA-binding transcriptional regulator GbsR (MarR family)